MWVTFRCRCGQLVRTSRGTPSVACPGCDRTIRLPNHYRLIWVVIALVIVGLAGVSVLAAVLPRQTVPSTHIDDQPPPGPPLAPKPQPQPSKPDAPPPKADEPPPQAAIPQHPQQPADPPKPAQPPAPRPGPPVVGRLEQIAPAGRYEVGDTFTQDVTVIRMSACGVLGLVTKQGAQYTLSSKLEVKAVHPDGSMTVEQTIHGGKLLDASSDMRDTIADALDKARGTTFTLTFVPTGKVTGLKGLNDPLKLQFGNNDLGRSLRVWSLLDADAWKELAGHTFFQPDKPALGAKWARDFTHDWGPLGSWLGRTDYQNARKAEKDGRIKIDYGHVISHRPGKGDGGDLGVTFGAAAFQPVKAGGHVVYDPKTNRLASAEELFIVKGEVAMSALGADVTVAVEEQQHFRVSVSEVKPREMVGRPK
ncbi:MAG: hypothetical protein ABGY75_07865 [Gemmataceae bacterium]